MPAPSYNDRVQKTLSLINLAAIERNASYIKSIIGDRKLYAVVKADAYGHGAERVALQTECVADGFCVAIAEEGAALRVAGVTKPILVLTPVTCAEDAECARYHNLQVTVNGVSSAAFCGGLQCHIKVNTGMNRYGCNVEQLPAVLSALEMAGAEVCGLYSHLYCPHIKEERESQLALFNKAEKLVKAAYPDVFCHLSASAGAFLGGEYLKDGVRCGIALYGYAPYGFSRDGLEPALKVYAPKVQTTPFAGNGAGYAVATKKYDRLSSYRAGYADGFFRTTPLGDGNLCMDAFVSEESCPLKLVFSDADEYAAKCGTISYEVLCSVTRRSQRVYLT